MKSFAFKCCLTMALLIATAILIPKPKPPTPFIEPWCEVEETDGELITPAWAARTRGGIEHHPAEVWLKGEIHAVGGKVPCNWLERKRNT